MHKEIARKSVAEVQNTFLRQDPKYRSRLTRRHCADALDWGEMRRFEDRGLRCEKRLPAFVESQNYCNNNYNNRGLLNGRSI